MSDVERLTRRFERERTARKHAESLIEEKSRELFQANQHLEQFNDELEQRVEQATAELRTSNQQLEQRVSELAALNSVATALSSVIDLQSLLERIIDLSKDVMSAQAASLLLLDEDTQMLRFHVAKGAGAAEIQDLTVALGQGIAGQVALSGQSELIPSAYSDDRFDPSYDQETGVRTDSLMAVPIRAKDQIIGVVEVINRTDGQSFETDDLRLFESFASSAGVAIENARLFGETKRMAEELREALEKERWMTIEREKMGAYIPRNVRDDISRNREQKLALGGKTVCVTIMFSDIKGFTSLSENMDPQELISILNEYMTAMTNVIEAHGGIVDKFIGDGIMAVFTESDNEQTHAHKAVAAGLDMQRRLRDLQTGWTESRPNLTGLSMRVGINTGEVVAGNVGSETRMDYTVMGDNVNVASRIESSCLPGQVMISGSTHDIVGVGTRNEPIHVKNRAQPVHTFALSIDVE